MKINKKYLLGIVFLFAFVIFAIFSILQVVSMKNSIIEFDNIIDTTEKMRISNIRLNNFITQKFTFINYDEVVKETNNFNTLLENLKKPKIYNRFNKKSKLYLKNIENDFEKKSYLLEHFKTINASTINAVPYLFDLAQAIKKEKKLNLHELNILGKAVTDTLKLSLNIKLNHNILQKDIENIKQLNEKYHDIKFSYLYMNIKATINNITSLYKIVKEYKKINLDTNLLKLLTILEEEHTLTNKKESLFSIVWLIMSFIFLTFFIYIYTKHIKTNEELESFKLAVENSDNSIVITDTNRNITYVNDAFTKATHYDKKEALGQNPRILKSGHLPEDFYKEMNETLDKGKKWTGEFINKDKYGKIYYEKASITPIIKKEKLTGYLAIKLDITDYIEQKKKIEFIAMHDALTELPNRRNFEEHIQKCLKIVQDKKSSLVVLFMDLDGFKHINDTLGHYIGDSLLISIAKKLTNHVSKHDHVFRIGGDEFAVILHMKSEHIKECDKVAERLLKIISEPIVIDSYTLKITASIGISIYPQDGLDAKTLLKHADSAMYEAKLEGKNCIKHYKKEFSDSLMKRLKIEQALSNAFKNKEFSVVYQPEYSLKTNKIVGFEALLRWHSKELGQISPSYFIPVAEDVGLIDEIGKMVFKEVCSNYKILKKRFSNLNMITVNVSSVQLMNENLFETFTYILKTENLQARNIGLEITETHIMKDITKSNILLKRFSNFGFKILIDDFGTGYSSMNYLKKLPIDILKIDKSFIDNICEDTSDIKIVKAIIAISKSMNYDIIVEGIEKKAQEKILRDLGANYAQGYFFSKPKSIDELLSI